jgi:hypothetical protein
MKRFITLLSLSLVLIIACKKEELENIVITPGEIPFTGKWTRTFEASPGGMHTESYAVYQDSLSYQIASSFVNSNYVIIKDTFLLTDNRFIGHTPENTLYILFVKEETDSTISVYKQEVASVAERITVEFPVANTTANYG